jgi:2,5-diamino-6-(ribosylamino)-4(3H)-pyrimidinone 5'-phosphate reductase
LSTRLQDRLERIRQVLNELCVESARGTPIVVEGKKDLETLRGLGVAGPILTAKTGGKSFVQALHEIQQTGGGQVVLLLDFDRRGKQGTSRLLKGLEGTGVKPDLTFWRALRILAGREIQCVESLTAYLATLEKKALF